MPVTNNLFFLSLAFFIFFSEGSVAQNNDKRIIFDFNSYNFSEPKTIHDYKGNFKGNLYQGNHAVSLNSASIGIEFNNFSLKIINRSDFIQSFSNETPIFYQKYKNNISSNENNEYKLEMTTSQFDALGLMFDYWHQVSSKFSFNIGATYYSGKDFNNGYLSGQVQWDNRQEFTIEAPAVIFSAHNDLLSFPRANSKGKGYSFNLGAKWQVNSGWLIEISSNDTVSKIKWSDALLTNINRWQLYQTNSDGKLDSSPMVNWQIKNYEQKLPKSTLGHISYTNNKNIEFYSRINSTDYFTHHQLGLKKPLPKNQSIYLSWHRDLSAIELGLIKPNSYVSLTADLFSSKIGRALNIEFGFSRPF
jgi:hypothetical protein